MGKGAAYRMIVEGQEDKFALIELMGHHISWPDDKERAPVWVELGGSADEILKTGYISSKLKESDVSVLGIVLDADEEITGRWNQISSLCADLFPTIPDTIPSEGLILENEDEMRFGVWIMPDNNSKGMLETFLAYLVPESSNPVLEYARDTVREAREKGASCRESHIDKAHVHTWLAWQDPPGQPLGRALTKKILDPHNVYAVPFVSWFRKLYRL